METRSITRRKNCGRVVEKIADSNGGVIEATLNRNRGFGADRTTMEIEMEEILSNIRMSELL